ncbi:hypothetical protein KI387_001889, partial [Taxus chinensis]
MRGADLDNAKKVGPKSIDGPWDAGTPVTWKPEKSDERSNAGKVVNQRTRGPSVLGTR